MLVNTFSLKFSETKGAQYMRPSLVLILCWVIDCLTLATGERFHITMELIAAQYFSTTVICVRRIWRGVDFLSAIGGYCSGLSSPL